MLIKTDKYFFLKKKIKTKVKVQMKFNCADKSRLSPTWSVPRESFSSHFRLNENLQTERSESAEGARVNTEHANNAASREAVITDGSILAEAYSLSPSRSLLRQTSWASAWIHPVTSISLGDRRRAVRTISLLAYYSIMWLLLRILLNPFHLRCTA